MSAPHHRTHHPAEHTGGDASADKREVWTVERIRALGAVTDLPTAARIFGVSRAGAYDLAKRGIFPVAVLRFGTRYRVSVAAILHALDESGNGQPTDPASSQTT
ncbi:helix-turn-helix domain-containing protein [Phytohabitans kaempferiae]|uniref:Helix-turn-helix domain-containing protein n=1 Tax=Phytohabitans kaempferiae TaxID=1620943 RepID=A0ABV6MBJ9_9ACTN